MTAKIIKNFNINKLNLQIMKVYKFESATTKIELQMTSSKDKDFFRGTYRIIHTRKKDNTIYVLEYYDWIEDATKRYLELISEWIS